MKKYVVAVFMILVAVIIGAIALGRMNENTSNKEFHFPVGEEDILWRPINVDEGSGAFEWNGFWISDKLSDLIQHVKTTDYIAIEVQGDIKQINQEDMQLVLNIFRKNGISATIKEDRLFIFANIDELKSVKINHKDQYYLSWATKVDYTGESEIPSNIPSVSNDVVGFDCSKFRIGPESAPYPSSSDEEIIESMNQLIQAGIYRWSQCVIVLYFDKEGLTAETLVGEMKCESIQPLALQCGVSIVVAYENLDMNVIRDISQMEVVKRIEIRNPRVLVNE